MNGDGHLIRDELQEVHIGVVVHRGLLGCEHHTSQPAPSRGAGLDDRMHARVAATGLTKPRQFAMDDARLIDAYIADRTDSKPRTIINFKAARKEPIEFFGVDKPLRDISDGDADEFWRYLLRPRTVGDAQRKGLGPNTARRICGRARQFYRVAIRKRLVQSNPFADIKSHVQGNTERDFFITRDGARRILDTCPETPNGS